ncbi:hypothetical protein NW759_002273 [Fusarium solani]|nr:hypothetical protein NW759_002273 [Fusarium solani]
MEGAVQVQGATFTLLQCTYAQSLSLRERANSIGWKFPLFDAPRPPPQSKLLLLLLPLLSNPLFSLFNPPHSPIAACLAFFLLPLLSPEVLLLLVIPSKSLLEHLHVSSAVAGSVLSRPTTTSDRTASRISHVDTSLGAFVL